MAMRTFWKCLIFSFAAASLQAGFITYTDRSSWEANVGSVITEKFSGFNTNTNIITSPVSIFGGAGSVQAFNTTIGLIEIVGSDFFPDSDPYLRGFTHQSLGATIEINSAETFAGGFAFDYAGVQQTAVTFLDSSGSPLGTAHFADDGFLGVAFTGGEQAMTLQFSRHCHQWNRRQCGF